MIIEIWQLALALLGAFILGSLMGLFLAALCFVSAEQDRKHWMEQE